MNSDSNYMSPKLHTDKTGRTYHYITLGFIILLFFLVCFYIYGQCFVKHPVIEYSNVNILDTEFEFEDKDGNITPITLPTVIKSVKVGDPVILRTILPDDINDDMYLCYYGGRDVEITIDGDTRFEHHSENMGLPGKAVKAIFFNIPVSSADRGKEMVIYKLEEHVNNANNGRILYGSVDAINSYIYLQYKTPFILALFLLFGSIVLSIIGWFLAKYGVGEFSIRFFAEGVVLLSWWEICESPTYQFALNNYYIDGIVSYMLMPFLLIPFIMFFNFVQNRRYERIYNIMMLFLLGSAIPYYILHFTNTLYFERLLGPMNALLMVETVLLLGILAWDYLHGLAKAYSMVVWGVCFLAFFGLLEILCNSLHRSANGMFVLLGLYIAVFFAVFNSFKEYVVLENEKTEALRQSVVKSQFLSNMSHELRTPINSIVGMNEMILRETEEPAIREYAEYIDRSSNLLLGLISDVLDFSKIEAGKVNTNEEEYDTANMLTVLTDILEERASAKNLSPVINVGMNIPKRLFGDEQHITQIMLNLISNATKYTNEGSVTLNTSFEKTSDDEGILRFEVIDTGIGIEENNVDKIFDSFTRFDEYKNKYIQGTGLGLAITRELVTALNGDISVSSIYGVGSTFTVTIPQKIVNGTYISSDWREIHEEPDKKVDTLVFTSPEAKILAVDDNVANLMIVKQFLKSTEASVDTATNGVEALECAKKNVYDLILLDYMMPVMDGVEAMMHIRGDDDSLNKETPIIILTANALAGSKEGYLEYGFSDYLSKPLKYDMFKEVVFKYLPKEKIVNEDMEKDEESVTSDFNDIEVDEEKKTMDLTIDIQNLVDIYGDEEFAMEIVKKVAEDSLAALDRMQNSYSIKDYNQYRIDAHGIKGMMASIYVAPMQEWAKKHEFAVKEDNLSFIDEDLEAFDKAVREFCNSILNK